jgi:hypothetical protein
VINSLLVWEWVEDELAPGIRIMKVYTLSNPLSTLNYLCLSLLREVPFCAIAATAIGIVSQRDQALNLTALPLIMAFAVLAMQNDRTP